MTLFDGDPNGGYGSIKASDVALTVRDLPVGWYTVREIGDRYAEIVKPAGAWRRKDLTQLLGRMGILRYWDHGTWGFSMDPPLLARMWPALPWKPEGSDPGFPPAAH